MKEIKPQIGHFAMFGIVLLMLRSCTNSPSQDAALRRCTGSSEEIRDRGTHANIGASLWCALTAWH